MLANVRINIAETVGVPFEIIAFDNSNGAMGICEVYNKGIAQARYEVLCFMHEDISIQTTNWGQIVARLFNETPGLGLIGVAGSAYKPLSPSGWRGMGGDRTDYLNVLQGYKHTANEPEHSYRNPRNEKLVPVATVDGVWLCTTRQVLSKARFDEQTFKGFHLYDLDFSMQVNRHYQVAVTFEVLLQHFSEGNLAKEWLTETLKFNQKWVERLPVCIEPLTDRQKFIIEKETFRAFVGYLIKFKFPVSWAYHELFHHLRYLRVYPSLFFKNLAFIGKAKRVARKQEV